MASAERVFTILDLRPETGSVAQEGLIEVPRLEGEVVFEDVCFAYKPGEPVLTDVCFRVSAGETIALVGPTGAGKTTIINLLARFYQP